MVRAEVVIMEDRCFGCGYCVKFCPQDCISILSDKFNAMGQSIPTFVNSDRCTACGACVWLCPHMALEVYQCIEN